ncbi:hypothetical protein PVAND_010995 [Polypedilum vanderplanki]|uniref:Peptidase S1 domain-containing protein n=1 Tax=Polypedilum vanderplanki TaxID=319348 RepID=A0A9J6CI78_POLVA|nr:hypothetical protein PVAND_010995 [Polypedilum vanderplanki]
MWRFGIASVFLLSFATLSVCQSSCGHMWRYIREGSEVQGILTLASSQSTSPVYYIRLTLTVAKSLILLSLAQNGNFDYEVYEYDPTSGQLKPVITTKRPNSIRTTKKYENNIFLTERPVTTQTPASTLEMSDRNEIISVIVNCDSLLTFYNDHRGIYAHLAVPPIYGRQNIYLKAFIKVATLLPTRYVGEISLVKDKESTINDVANGQPILYRIRFPIQNPIPKLTAVHYNNQLICTGPHDVGEFVTTIQLDHTLYTGLSNNQLKPVGTNTNNYNNNVNNINFAPPPSRPQTQAPFRTTAPPTRPPPFIPQTQPPAPVLPTNSAERASEFSAQCGIPFYRPKESTGLVVGGKTGVKGQFPWYAAFHHNGIGNSGFICGGSLVSTKVVITAAHCVQDKRDAVIRRADESLFYLGKYYLNSQPQERDYIISAVAEFKVHSDWNPYAESFDGDIAAAILIRTIQFTNFIRPICIWTATQSYNDIINRNGAIVGYGKTEFSSSATDKPYYVELPVVDEGTCLRSNSAFSKITSRRTFCVGSRDGSGPCNGDSGGAYAVKSGGKWYLRGVVSSSLIDANTLACDTQNYAVFTDTAAFKDWILQIIEIHG